MNIFLNCTQHALTPAQLEAIKGLGCDEIIELKDINRELFDKLSNTPSEKEELAELANRFMNLLCEKNAMDKLYVHLPIGSPAFMFVFSLSVAVQTIQEEMNSKIHFVFSHSERMSKDEMQADGTVVKRTVFNFSKFITI